MVLKRQGMQTGCRAVNKDNRDGILWIAFVTIFIPSIEIRRRKPYLHTLFFKVYKWNITMTKKKIAVYGENSDG
jgi:hypothetical protein